MRAFIKFSFVFLVALLSLCLPPTLSFTLPLSLTFSEPAHAKEELPQCVQNPDFLSSQSKSKLKAQAAIYKDIFEAQTAGEFDTANDLVKKLKDCRLMGHVTLQRFLHPNKYKASFAELRDWLDLYAHYPNAKRIYRLAELRRPEGNQDKLRVPNSQSRVRGYLEESLMLPNLKAEKNVSRAAEKETKVRSTLQEISHHISNGFPTGALRVLNESSGTTHMTKAEKNEAKARIGFSYLIEGKPEKALSVSKSVSQNHSDRIPVAAWSSGLAHWQLGRFKKAAIHFERAAKSRRANGWLSSAAAFWASRAHLRAKNYEQVDVWLRRAASYPRTFYGLLAIEVLGQDFDFNWSAPKFDNASYKRLLEEEAGLRAYMLILADQPSWADIELGLIDVSKDDTLKQALIAFVLDKDLPGVAYRLGNAYKDKEARFYDAALYPVLSESIFPDTEIDPALIHAFIRQESKFSPRVESGSGAIGLMQILPSTAAYVTDNVALKDEETWRLKDAQTNITVGDAYISELLSSNTVDDSLLKLMVAYNAGPGNLARWEKEIDTDDALLFIELIPSPETRAFVERVMRNFWIYRMRFGQDTPSLKDLASGAEPLYRSLDKE